MKLYLDKWNRFDYDFESMTVWNTPCPSAILKFMKTSGAREMPVRVTNENSKRPRPQNPTGHLLENQHFGMLKKKSLFIQALFLRAHEKCLYSIPSFWITKSHFLVIL